LLNNKSLIFVFLPTPGSSGGIEFAFAAIISALSTNASGALSNAGIPGVGKNTTIVIAKAEPNITKNK